MNITKSAIVAGVAFLGSAMLFPVSAEVQLNISGNGSRSDNTIRYTSDSNVTLRQSNNTNISNNVDISGITGGNRVRGTTGGDVQVRTGDVESDVSIHNAAGINVANLSSCGTCNGEVQIGILGNGSRSDNSVYYSSENNLILEQDNDTNIDNNVDINAHTGQNSVYGTTGGDVEVQLGDVDSTVTIHNEAGKNVAHISGCNTCDNDTHIKIHGNGTGSDNTVFYSSDNSKNIDQDNDTDFDNNVNVNQSTGHNVLGGSGSYHYKWYPHYSDKYHDYDEYKKKYYHDYHNKYVKYYEEEKYSKNHDKKHVGYKKYYPHHDYVTYSYPKKVVYKPIFVVKDYNDDYNKDYKKYDYKYQDIGYGKKYDVVKHHVPYGLVKKHYNHDNEYKHNYDNDYSEKLNWYPYHNWYNHGNTGGDVEIRTGDVHSEVEIKNSGSSNILTL